jgi:hypothetical protein
MVIKGPRKSSECKGFVVTQAESGPRKSMVIKGSRKSSECEGFVVSQQTSLPFLLCCMQHVFDTKKGSRINTQKGLDLGK